MRRYVFVLLIAACTGGTAAKYGEGSDYDDGLFDTRANLAAPARQAAGEPPSGAAAKTWKRSQLTPNTSTLMVGDKEKLPLRAMRAKARIEGFRARVTLDLFFFNDKQRQLEGNFKVRLPNGATPVRLGFGKIDTVRPSMTDPDKWAAPKEARVVPRQRAAMAYGETVRRRVDPALLEWAGAGVFSARVFPLIPERMHRIVLSYEVNLLPIGDQLEYRLDLPEGVQDLHVHVTLDGEVKVDERNPKERSFLVRRPLRNMAMAGDGYFAAVFAPAVAAKDAPQAEQAVFLMDVSLSSNPERFNVWIELLEAILAKNPIKSFKVGFFNIETFWWRADWTPNNDASRAALRAELKQIALEGATDLGQALDAAREQGGGAIFLLSDASPTWGEDDIHAFKPHAPLFAYSTGFAGTDKRVLDQLARASGGAVFSVTGPSEVAQAAVAHARQPWRIEGIEVEGGSDLLLAGRPTSIFPGQRLWLAGRGTPKGDIRLTLRRGDERKTARAALREPVESGFAGSIYGQIAVGQLEELGRATEDTARAYATHFRVVGQTCSLLMLETQDDYERFNIKPQEDAYVVHHKPAAAVVSETLQRIETTLGDPKARLLAWLDRLEDAPGLEFKTPPALKIALERMPAAAFAVKPGTLTCEVRHWTDIDGPVTEQLASRKLTYDTIMKDARRRREKLGSPDGLRSLSSLVEHSPGDLVLARDVGFTALEWGLGAQAYHLFRRVAEKRPYEPNTVLAMAHCLEAMGQPDLAMVYFEVALAGNWDARFGDFHTIAGYDYVRFLRGARLQYLSELARGRRATVTETIGVKNADLVVTIAWTTDRTDVDLHVKDPRGEDCFYGNRRTKAGGKITQDVTTGFGPELFLARRAVRGTYGVRVKYFASDARRVSARTRVLVTVYENWGRDTETVTRRMVTLAYGKEMHDIARVKW